LSKTKVEVKISPENAQGFFSEIFAICARPESLNSNRARHLDAIPAVDVSASAVAPVSLADRHLG
jgi:hypothetical protein